MPFRLGSAAACCVPAVLLEKLSDRKVSFTDCISFRLIKSRGIKLVFGLDRHLE